VSPGESHVTLANVLVLVIAMITGEPSHTAQLDTLGQRHRDWVKGYITKMVEMVGQDSK